MTIGLQFYIILTYISNFARQMYLQNIFFMKTKNNYH